MNNRATIEALSNKKQQTTEKYPLYVEYKQPKIHSS